MAKIVKGAPKGQKGQAPRYACPQAYYVERSYKGLKGLKSR